MYMGCHVAFGTMLFALLQYIKYVDFFCVSPKRATCFDNELNGSQRRMLKYRFFVSMYKIFAERLINVHLCPFFMRIDWPVGEGDEWGKLFQLSFRAPARGYFFTCANKLMIGYSKNWTDDWLVKNWTGHFHREKFNFNRSHPRLSFNNGLKLSKQICSF